MLQETRSGERSPAHLHGSGFLQVPGPPRRIDAYTNAGLRWCFFSGTSGDHTEHSSGVSGERALVIQHAEQAGCPKGRADNFGCLRHGYQLVNGAGLKALWSVKAQAEAHARLMWENFTADRGTNAKQWIAAGLCQSGCG